MTCFLVLHGLGGSTSGHWQEWLTKELKKRGERVWFPQFPQWDHPVRESWINCLEETIDEIPKDEPLVVVTHSLGCILWIHYASQHNARKVDRVIMVCPPSEHLDNPEIQNFFPLPKDKASLPSIAKKTLLILSTNDRFLPQEEMKQYFDFHVPCLIFPEQGHINIQSGYGPWPWILRFCLEDAAYWPCTTV
ncbi:MAG: alpha/beta fold hydrolase [Sporolactobacillus sp.]|uniref:RBBP9/YdeN family alpha/beta hydrolase n=1 Tax=Sporolactobacillus sp. STSJ-5 TaxID=2965076 RepID=UPI0021058F1E|nr:alpha/beta fold hydrolase [Sporolactobacillus sp. STSJ-5]MCQ2011525.1 alpha/beta hydrolase [Sporolactobacillus sp. STSJ-5]